MPVACEPAYVPCKLDAQSHQWRTTSQSRSTSAGTTSSSAAHSLPENNVYAEHNAQVARPSGLPEFEYPVPYNIRNTFVDTGLSRPLSLDEFYEERRVRSCPVVPPGCAMGSEDLAQAQLQRAATAGTSMMASAVAAAAAASAAAAAATRCWMSSVPHQRDTVSSKAACGRQGPVLSLFDLMQEPELGSPELPTVGSAGHHAGTCKPCAFYHTKGCGNGVNCSFCHLCPAGEKKRRQKEKVAMLREGNHLHL